jgi:hypothetical protein
VIVAFAFDTLGYSKRLRDAGVLDKQAEAHAEAARDFIMTELATKSDLAAVRADLQTMADLISLRLTVRLGGIVIAGVGVMVACIGILGFFLRSH